MDRKDREVSESERYYDDVLAPKLAGMARDACAHGLSFLAVVEWEPGDYGRTMMRVEESSFAFRLVDMAVHVQGNVDALWLAIQKHAMTHGHSSMFLSGQGIPEKAKAPDG